jgi:trehalose 6-phosphate phosphatase
MQTSARAHKSNNSPSPDAVDLSRMALLLDVDGTLLDIAPTPDEVVVPPLLLQILADLIHRSHGAVALVSGRMIDTLDRIFSPLIVPAIGGHGAEMRLSPNASVLRKSNIVLPDLLRDRLHELAEGDARLILEDKSHSAALHYRLAPEREMFLKNALHEIVETEPGDNVEFLCGKYVIDIKPKTVNKGHAVRELMRHEPFAGRIPLFIGDDTTDESVFAILPDLNGTGYSVGRSFAGTQGKFETPQDVRGWLTEIWRHGRNNA